MPDDDLKDAVVRIEHRLDDIDGRLSHIEQDGLSLQVQDHERRIGDIEGALTSMRKGIDRIERQIATIFGTAKTAVVILGSTLVVLQIVNLMLSLGK